MSDIQKYADAAMYRAEPVETKGPRVYLLNQTADPLGSIAAATEMYKGNVVRDLVYDLSREQKADAVAQIMKTHLKAPFEFVDFHFLLEGVTRSFTHQLVRQRTAVYAQESLRFAVKDDMPVGLPPSLEGLKDDDPRVAVWNGALDDVGRAYQALIGAGVPAEDARGLLPHNVLTRVHYKTNLRALLEHAGNRLCTQAQFEWRLVFTGIAQAIREYQWGWKGTTEWQQEILAGLFQPICYMTGKCEFKANFDRACSIRERVDSGDFSSIHPREWLADPKAAR